MVMAKSISLHVTSQHPQTDNAFSYTLFLTEIFFDYKSLFRLV